LTRCCKGLFFGRARSSPPSPHCSAPRVPCRSFA
jgi:hypothetical protein